MTNTLAAAVAAGLIPDIPVATLHGDPVYKSASGTTLNPSSPAICSSTQQCRDNTTVYDAPDGMVGISFDDGPLPVSICHLCL